MKRQNNIQILAESFVETRSPKCFKNLYERLKPGITNHCYLILKNQELAEDAFSNTMAKIWQKIHQYDFVKGKMVASKKFEAIYKRNR